MTLVRILVPLSVLWAAVALAVQVARARGGGRRDYSRRAGSPGKGLVYNFTVAMLPAHKETAWRHPAKFAIGMVMHAGVILALLCAGLLLAWPPAGHWLIRAACPLIALALLAGVYLLIRRIVSRDLRALSAPDDYVAMSATCVLLALAAMLPLAVESPVPFLVYTALLFAYLPLGKLRHAVFFFVARGDYGRRLGYRGVYPPAVAGAE